ncbi:MAG: hypothetical protein R6X08_01975 [Desulfosalsimonadaceae bacterium]
MRIQAFFLKKILTAALILLLTGLPAAGKNFSLDAVQKELSVIKAPLIDGPRQTLLLGKGSREGVAKGDLFTVYSREREVVDPDSGQTLGAFSEPVAVCRVKRTEPGFSVLSVKCLRKKCSVKPGMEAVRFRDVPALFMDSIGAAGSLYTVLRARLRHLDWQGYKTGEQMQGLRPEAASANAVVFEAAGDMLTLWSGGEIQAVYPDYGQSRQADEDRTAKSARQAEKARQPDRRPGSGDASVLVPGMTSEIQISSPRVFASLDRLVHNFRVVEDAENRQPYLISLSGKTVEARSVDGDESFKYSYEGFGRVAALTASDSGLVALSIYVPDKGMRSRILRLTGSGFRIVAEDLAYVLAFMRQPGGSTQLLGQRFSRSDLLLPVLHKLRLDNGAVKKEKTLAVPYGYSLFGAFHADLDRDGSREKGFFNSGGRLVLYESGERVWQSSENFAASLNSLLVADPDNEDAAPAEMQVWSQPALFSYKGRYYAACALNQPGLSGMLGGGPRKGTVGILECPDGSCRLSRLQERFSGPIQDVAVYRDKLLICVLENGFFRGKGRSHILSVPLKALLPSKQ